MDKQLLEAQILYGATVLGYYPQDFNVEDFSYFKKTAKAINDLKEKNIEIDIVSVISKAGKQEVMEWWTITQEQDKLGLIETSEKLINERVELLKELKTKEEIEKTTIIEWDTELIYQKLSKLQKKGAGRFITGEELKHLIKKFMEEKKKNSLLYNLPFLDAKTRGIANGQYIIVAGRPSVGKSAFLQFIGLKNAQDGKKVVFFSAEMGEELVVERLVKKYNIETLPSTFNLATFSSVSSIESEIEKRKKEIDLILIDYIQILQPKTRTKDMYERITEISSDLKKLTTKYNIPIIAASQYSRQAEARQPRLSDLRESGALEQDADVVISLWRNKEDDDLNTNKKEIKIIRLDLLKNRQGETFSNGDGFEYKIAFNFTNFDFYEIEIKDSYDRNNLSSM